MKIKYLNHSSYIVYYDNVSLLVDPWIDGRVFNNGWALITPTPFGYDDCSQITHIWFSHEHPDHFNPPNLNKIPLEYRRRITVLFQVTRDKRVVTACRKLGFKDVVELHPNEWLPLTSRLEALCENYGEGDSWLALRTPTHLHFNTNDCGIRDVGRARQILQKVGRPDVLFSQFSYAFWAGNPDQIELRREMAHDKLYGLKFQCDMFGARQVIPIASYIWFCHRENCYLNDSINTPRACFDYLSKNSAAEPVILYPGEEFSSNESHDSNASIARYEKDYAMIGESGELVKSDPVAWETLCQSANEYVRKLASNPWSRFLLRRPTKIYLWDFEQSFTLDLKHGIRKTSRPWAEAACDVSMSAESLQYCLRFPWGHDTLGVNGRFRKPPGGSYSRFHNFFRFEQLRSRGVDVDASYLFNVVRRKIYNRLGMGRYRPRM